MANLLILQGRRALAGLATWFDRGLGKAWFQRPWRAANGLGGDDGQQPAVPRRPRCRHDGGRPPRPLKVDDIRARGRRRGGHRHGQASLQLVRERRARGARRRSEATPLSSKLENGIPWTIQ